MLTSWDLYWITRLDKFVVMLCVPAVFVTIAATVSMIIGIVYSVDSTNQKYKDYDGPDSHYKEWGQDYWLGLRLLRYSKYGAIPALLLWAAFAVTPTTKEMFAIKFIPPIVNNEKVQAIPENAADLINEQLKAWIKGLETKKEATKK